MVNSWLASAINRSLKSFKVRNVLLSGEVKWSINNGKESTSWGLSDIKLKNLLGVNLKLVFTNSWLLKIPTQVPVSVVAKVDWSLHSWLITHFSLPNHDYFL
jgi:hypothetical protein